jgi:hypothetical protein
MRQAAAIAGALAAVGVLAPPAAAVDFAVKMAELTRNPAAYVGQRVIISDCLMISFTKILGAQCSVSPIDASILLYVDSDTMSAAALKIAEGCQALEETRMCTLKVTGEVSLNYRYQPIIINGTLEILKRAAAI